MDLNMIKIKRHLMYICTFKLKEEVNLSDATGEIPTILIMAGNSGTMKY